MNDRVGVVVVPLLLVAVWLVRAPRRWGRSRRLLERDPSRCGALAGRREAVRWRWAGLGLVPADDILGRRSAEAVVAATGGMVATLLFGVALCWCPPPAGPPPLGVRPAFVPAGGGGPRSSGSARPPMTRR